MPASQRISLRVRIEPALASWQRAARSLLADDVPPESILWDDGSGTPPLFGASYAVREDVPRTMRVPSGFATLAEAVACHRHDAKWTMLYTLLWRITHGERSLLRNTADPLVAALRDCELQVERDVHKMHAFVRFKRVETEDGEEWLAWYNPDHDVVARAVPLFVERFRGMRWSIVTPRTTVRWDGTELQFAPGAGREVVPHADDLEQLWRTYYRSVFNPARTNLKAMRAEMPSRFWNQLPELTALPSMLRAAPVRVEGMLRDQQDAASAAPFVPSLTHGEADARIEQLREAAQRCRGCELYEAATRTVFGNGISGARIVLVGEQPGDEEDRRSEPFIGPAGRLLDEALQQAGIERADLYLTNAVKHFHFEERGKRRIHKTPRTSHVTACRPWLEAELAAIEPSVVVCLGGTAAKSLLGGTFRVTQDRGKPIHGTRWAPVVLATLHPSAILRTPDADLREQWMSMLVEDLRLARQFVEK